MNQVLTSCDLLSECVAPTVIDQLKGIKKDTEERIKDTERRLSEINRAIKLLDKNPELSELLTIVIRNC